MQYQSVLANAITVDRWQWDFGMVVFRGKKIRHIFLKRIVAYTTRLWAVSGDCTSDTIAKTIAISRVHAFAGNDTIAVVNQSIQLNASGGTNYEWMPHDFLNNAFIADPVATLTRDQTYVLTVKNDDGCAAKDTINIKVYEHLEIYIPSAFTPNGDGKN